MSRQKPASLSVRLATVLGAAATALVVTVYPARSAAAQTQTVYNTSLPSLIHVAIREGNNPRGPILWVQTVGFEEYCDDVLPNEWMPSWSPEALRAGAVAIKMFAWYHTLHPVTIAGFTFDVDNTTNFQEYKYLSGTTVTNAATRSTWREVFVPPSGVIQQLDYRAGIPNSPNWAFVGSQRMAQWGSQYWGAVALMSHLNILNLYYPGLTMRYI
ncbi:SpoIID/LytB domain-containing protein [Alicyclobacillus sp. ALC3]|uniref:SpoIID/LytB domain-containing protein n=1 Tax=Alicyclobacillus sp. ALC3 TaxID=2796143 RepID=UPI002379C4AA|nr:SpoIID/LytB domain-containing protein [Alicyclobacillus sp. ALC3]WDL95798.1 SpoIID/LytB domain-containing protein [Alicyclobacillus sp. ALC3]